MKLKQLIGFNIKTEQPKMLACDIGNLNEFGCYKEICRRFSSVFDSKFKYDDELFRCTKCGQMFCSFECIHDREETIAFDFGSKTTWFKYTGEMTGQLSMHPTVAPVAPAGEDSWSSWNSLVANSMATAHECCPFCARRKFLRSSRNGAAVVADAAVDRKPGQFVSPPNRLTKALSRFSSFRHLRCFRVSEGGEEDEELIVLCGSDTRGSAVVPDHGGLLSCDVIANRHLEAITTYRFLLQHLLSRSSFYHLHSIPFVICEPIECDRTMMLELVKHILCQLKAPG